MTNLSEADLYNIHAYYKNDDSGLKELKFIFAEHLYTEHKMSMTEAAKRIGIKRKELKEYLDSKS